MSAGEPIGCRVSAPFESEEGYRCRQLVEDDVLDDQLIEALLIVEPQPVGWQILYGDCGRWSKYLFTEAMAKTKLKYEPIIVDIRPVYAGERETVTDLRDNPPGAGA